MKHSMVLLVLTLSLSVCNAQEQPMSERIAATIMDTWPDSIMSLTWKRANWTYTTGLVLKGIEDVWMRTGDKKYYDYLLKNIDFFVQNDGTIKMYKLSHYDIDALPPGRNLLLIWQVTGEDKYLKSIQLLRSQIANQPRTKEGGFCHKGEYHSQMWLDGLYMGEPFYAEYSRLFNEPGNFDDIANQFIWMEKHARDPKTGLLYHAWDESKAEKWADKTTGCSPEFWGRAMGWYGMALVDVLEVFPADHPKRKALLEILSRYVTAILKVQDNQTGLWYQVLDKSKLPGSICFNHVCLYFGKRCQNGIPGFKIFNTGPESVQRNPQKICNH
jgi:unsaturated rhamnogalacturonyl hydrolase